MALKPHVVISKRLVAINSASSLIAKIVNVTVLLWMYQYLLNRISAEEFAVLPVVTSILIFAPLFFSFFTGGISRFVVEAYSRGDFEAVTGIVTSVFPLLICAGFVFVTVGTLFSFHMDKILNIPAGSADEAQVMLLLLIANFTLQMLVSPFLSGFHVKQRFVELNLIGVARDALKTFLLLLFLLGIGPKVIWVVVATTISETLYSLVMVLRARAMVPQLHIDKNAYSWSRSRQVIGFGLWTTLGRLGNLMYTNAATILLNVYGSPVDVTNYYLGATFYRQIDTTLQLAAQPLQPTLTAMHAQNDAQRLTRTVLRGGRYAMWVTLAVATPLAFFSDVFIQLYVGSEYTRATPVIIFFMLIFPFTAPTALLAMTAMAIGHVRAFFLPAFLFQLLGLIFMVVILRYTETGAIGVTLSLTAITIASQLLYYWPLCAQTINIDKYTFFSDVLKPGLIPAVVCASVALMLRWISLPESWVALIGYGTICTLVYVLALIFLVFEHSDRHRLTSEIGKLMRFGRKKKDGS